LATGSYYRQAGHIHPLASARLSTVLEAEIGAQRATSHIPAELQNLNVEMANGNPTWGEEHQEFMGPKRDRRCQRGARKLSCTAAIT